MESRITESPKFSKKGYDKMIKKINIVSRDKQINAIKKFFEIGESKIFDEAVLINKSNDEVKNFCNEICTEAINRDFCSFVSTGDKGTVGQKVYEALA